jgi:hypothetical protein
MSIRNRTWLEEYVRQPLADTPRNRRYLELLEPQWDAERFRQDLDWLRDGGDPQQPLLARELNTWHEYLDWVRDGGDGAKAFQARRLTNWLGFLAFHLHAAHPSGARRTELVTILREGFRHVTAHITPEGRFVWPFEPGMYWAGSHEHAWRLEPLLLGALWMGKELDDEERAQLDTALRRAAQWLADNPLLQTNNRGAVWCAVLTLCGLYFDEPKYSSLAHRHAVEILSDVVLPDGESGEHTEQYGGGGPCSNYSYTGWSYVYLYRLLSDDDRLDDRLLQASRWFTLYNTISGCPLAAGASVRRRYCDPGSFKDTLPMWEQLTQREPFFALVAERALDKIGTPARLGNTGHIVSAFIWAALENSPVASQQPRPAWHAHFTHLYHRPEVEYALISRASYQTGVTLRGRTNDGYNFPLRGLQAFACYDELPILLHTDNENSYIQNGGVNTATDNALEAHLQEGDAELTTLAVRYDQFRILYVFTEASVMVICDGNNGKLGARWALNRAFVSEPTLDEAAKRVRFAGRRGCIHYQNGEAQLLSPKPEVSFLQVTSAAPYNSFAFSDDNFRFEADEQQLTFRDTSGRYRIKLQDMLDADGNLNRAVALIVKCGA